MFTEFAFRHFYLHYRKHLPVVLLFTLLVFLLSSSLLMSESIRFTTQQTLSGQPDLIVQHQRGGRIVEIPIEWTEKLASIPGVSKAVERVYGYYDFEAANARFLIAGIHLFTEESMQDFDAISGSLDKKAFFSQPSMLIGTSVQQILHAHAFTDHFNFILPDGGSQRLHIAGILEDSLTQFGGDSILTPIPYARDLLGYDKNHATDIALHVPNPDERLLIAHKVRELYPEARIIDKGYLQDRYNRLFDYKSGLFLALFTTVLAAFFILLFHKAGALSPHEKKEIAIMRAVGWSINDVLRLKIIEASYTALVAFCLGFLLAYGFVFGLEAPLLRNIFLGDENILTVFTLQPHIEPYLPVSLFFFSVIPYLIAVVYPAWRAAITDIHEALR